MMIDAVGSAATGGLARRKSTAASLEDGAAGEAQGFTQVSKVVRGRRVSVRISNPDESALPQTGSGSSPRVSALEPSKSTIIVEEETSGFLLNRNGVFLRYWDIAMLLVLLFTGLATPFEVAFIDQPSGHDEFIDPLFIINTIIEITFAFDMCLHFFTPYSDDDVDMKHIAVHYMKGTFFLDLITVIPFDLMVPGEGSTLRLIRLIRLLKLAKILRALHANKLVDRLKVRFGISAAFIRMCTFAVGLVLEAHWVACLLHLTAILEAPGTDTWVTTVAVYMNTPWERYSASLQWATSLVSLVGATPVSPVTPVERVIVVIVQLIAAGVYALLIGNMATVLANADKASQQMAAERDDLNRYMAEVDLPAELRRQMREHFDHVSRFYRFEFYGGMLRHISPALRAQIAWHAHSGWITKISYFTSTFEDEQLEFAAALAERLRPEAFGPFEIILREGLPVDRLFAVVKGLGVAGTRIVGNGDHFGDTALLTNGKSIMTVRSLTYLSVLTVSQADVWAILDRGSCGGIRRAVRKAVIRMALRRQFLECLRLSRLHRGALAQLLGREGEDDDVNNNAAASSESPNGGGSPSKAAGGGGGRRRSIVSLLGRVESRSVLPTGTASGQTTAASPTKAGLLKRAASVRVSSNAPAGLARSPSRRIIGSTATANAAVASDAGDSLGARFLRPVLNTSRRLVSFGSRAAISLGMGTARGTATAAAPNPAATAAGKANVYAVTPVSIGSGTGPMAGGRASGFGRSQRPPVAYEVLASPAATSAASGVQLVSTSASPDAAAGALAVGLSDATPNTNVAPSPSSYARGGGAGRSQAGIGVPYSFRGGSQHPPLRSSPSAATIPYSARSAASVNSASDVLGLLPQAGRATAAAKPQDALVAQLGNSNVNSESADTRRSDGSLGSAEKAKLPGQPLTARSDAGDASSRMLDASAWEADAPGRAVSPPAAVVLPQARPTPIANGAGSSSFLRSSAMSRGARAPLMGALHGAGFGPSHGGLGKSALIGVSSTLQPLVEDDDADLLSSRTAAPSTSAGSAVAGATGVAGSTGDSSEGGIDASGNNHSKQRRASVGRGGRRRSLSTGDVAQAAAAAAAASAAGDTTATDTEQALEVEMTAVNPLVAAAGSPTTAADISGPPASPERRKSIVPPINLPLVEDSSVSLAQSQPQPRPQAELLVSPPRAPLDEGSIAVVEALTARLPLLARVMSRAKLSERLAPAAAAALSGVRPVSERAATAEEVSIAHTPAVDAVLNVPDADAVLSSREPFPGLVPGVATTPSDAAGAVAASGLEEAGTDGLLTSRAALRAAICMTSRRPLPVPPPHGGDAGKGNSELPADSTVSVQPHEAAGSTTASGMSRGNGNGSSDTDDPSSSSAPAASAAVASSVPASGTQAGSESNVPRESFGTTVASSSIVSSSTTNVISLGTERHYPYVSSTGRRPAPPPPRTTRTPGPAQARQLGTGNAGTGNSTSTPSSDTTSFSVAGLQQYTALQEALQRQTATVERLLQQTEAAAAAAVAARARRPSIDMLAAASSGQQSERRLSAQRLQAAQLARPWLGVDRGVLVLFLLLQVITLALVARVLSSGG